MPLGGSLRHTLSNLEAPLGKENEHLVDWKENEHKTSPKETGCLWRHADYGEKRFPRCDYRKNAHDYSKVAEKYIYNIPNFRSSERWVEVWLDRLGPSMKKKRDAKGRALKNPDGSPSLEPMDDTRPAAPANGGWNLDRGKNFMDWKLPYWHNTHHVIACGEIKEVFPSELEQQIIVATRWNINEMPNVIILPKQYTVARILKLPTHVPPDGPAEHDNYSKSLGSRLNAMKATFAKKKDQNGHEVVDADKSNVREELEKASAAIRKFLLACGEKNPGINLDNLKLDSVNW